VDVGDFLDGVEIPIVESRDLGQLGSRLDLTVAGHYRLYDFPNAFAFNNPDQGVKTLESQDIDVSASYRMTRSLFLVLEASIAERVSTDSRIEFQRSQFVLGVHWVP